MSLQVDDHLLDLARELERHSPGIVLQDRRASVFADVQRLIDGVQEWHRSFDSTLRYRIAIHGKNIHAALSDLLPSCTYRAEPAEPPPAARITPSPPCSGISITA